MVGSRPGITSGGAETGSSMGTPADSSGRDRLGPLPRYRLCCFRDLAPPAHVPSGTFTQERPAQSAAFRAGNFKGGHESLLRSIHLCAKAALGCILG